MTPWILLDTAAVPNTHGELRLYRRADEFSIRLTRGGELMNNRVHGSEEGLAALACSELAGQPSPQVLIGGLGMGFTLAASLRILGAGAKVTVAELIPAVVNWNRDHFGAFSGEPLNDPRVEIVVGDVAALLRKPQQGFDAIMLDVDNGPEGLTRKENDWLYSVEGLEAAYDVLRPGGVLAVWSAGPDRAFSERLRRVGFEVDERSVRAHAGGKGARHTIWLARRAPELAGPGAE